MSAAASATRACCAARRWRWRGWRGAASTPVRWLEDCREHLSANANCREHHYRITGYADRDGRLLALDCVAHVDAGAYSVYPTSSALEAAQIASLLPGPTISPPIAAAPRRSPPTSARSCPIAGWRAPACASRSKSSWMRSRAQAGHRAVRGAAAQSRAPRADAVRERGRASSSTAATIRNACAARWRRSACRRSARASSAAKPDGRLIGVGFSIFCEQGAHGHRGARRLGPSGRARLRAGDRAADSRWRHRDSRRHPFARPGPRDHVGADRARDPRRRLRRASRCCRATRSTARSRPAPGARARS